jgi:hypothetical protein
MSTWGTGSFFSAGTGAAGGFGGFGEAAGGAGDGGDGGGGGGGGGGGAGGSGGGAWGGAPLLAPAPGFGFGGAPAAGSPSMAIVPATPTASSVAGLPAPAQPLFGLVAGTRGVVSDFRILGQLPPSFVCEVAAPAACAEVALFLAPGIVLPAGAGVVAYWAPVGQEAWSVLATLDAQRPSTIVRTGWPKSRELAGAAAVRVCCALADASDVTSAAMAIAANEQAQLPFVQLVARDLANFCASFAQRVPGLGDAIALPADAMQRWLARFDARYRAEGAAFLSRAQ